MHELLKQNQEIWDIFTRKEEYLPEKLDKHGRFLSADSDLKKTLEPVVSKYLTENGLKVDYPENKSFAVCLTHDVDDIYPPISHSLLSLYQCTKALDLHDSANHLFWRLKGKEYSPYINLSQIMDLEAIYGAKSSFYFIATEADPLRFRYNVEDIGDKLGEIYDRGWEVGLHGGYYSYDNMEAIKNEKKRIENVLGKKIIGFRNHYLRFKTPNSWEILANAGFKYDSTLGHSRSVGFRNGMCHPFRPYNLKEGREIEILEIPLVIMDVALFACSRSFEEAWEYTKNLIDTTAKFKGVITLLWHNFVFSCSFRKDWVRLYKKALEYCSGRGAWITSGKEIYRWWENNS